MGSTVVFPRDGNDKGQYHADAQAFCAAYGTSLGAAAMVAEEHGYSFVGVDGQYLDAFFVRKDLLAGSPVPAITDPVYANAAGLHDPPYQPHQRCTSDASKAIAFTCLDYKVFKET